MGMEIESSEERSLVESLTIGRRRGDGALPIARKVESLRVEMSLPGGNILTYDTTNPKPRSTPGFAFLGDVFKLAGEVAYTVVLDNHNKVKAVEGTENFKEKAGEARPKDARYDCKEFETETFKRSFEQALQILPDILARPGEPWERTEIIEGDGGQTLSFRRKYEYQGTEKKGDKTLDKISSKVLEVKNNHESQQQLALETYQERLKGRVLSTEESCSTASRSRGQRQGKDTDQRRHHLLGQWHGIPSVMDLSIETNVDLQPAAK